MEKAKAFMEGNGYKVVCETEKAILATKSGEHIVATFTDDGVNSRETLERNAIELLESLKKPPTGKVKLAELRDIDGELSLEFCGNEDADRKTSNAVAAPLHIFWKAVDAAKEFVATNYGKPLDDECEGFHLVFPDGKTLVFAKVQATYNDFPDDAFVTPDEMQEALEFANAHGYEDYRFDEMAFCVTHDSNAMLRQHINI